MNIDSKKIDRSKPVMVTGGSGYIASWIIKYLLEDGVNVHATVRDPDNAKKVAHLTAIADAAPGNLTLFKADLLDREAFDAPMQGCELVMHTASPFFIGKITDPQKQFIDPAVQGTEAVLDACNRTESVKRVVLTTSCAAIYGDNADMTERGLTEYTEAQWNESSSLEHNPYSYSKTVAEKRAWEMQKAQGRWDLLCINPSLVLGPSLTGATISGSVALILDLARGKMYTGAPDLPMGIVDVRDVAMAHIKAGFTPSASGRHITSSETATLMDISKVWKAHFGNHWKFPMMVAPKPIVWLIGPTQGITRKFVSRNVGHPLVFNNSYTEKDLGMKFRPIKETVIDHFQQMLDDGLVRDKRKAA